MLAHGPIWVCYRAMDILDFDYAYLNGELDMEKFLHLSSEILVVEIIHRLFISIYEVKVIIVYEVKIV